MAIGWSSKRLTSTGAAGTIAAMRRDQVRLAVLLLLLAAFAAPELLWASVHAIEHHRAHAAAPDHGASGCPEAGMAVAVLLHGHAHPDGTPEHGHELLNAPPFRLDPRPESPPASAGQAWAAALAEPVSQSAARTARPSAPPGAGPPLLLHLLCALLI
jgi:hypothetical protein